LLGFVLVVQMRFVTPILHANVNCYGRICHSVLGRQWTSDTKLSTVLGCVYG
jgi:ubiquitin-protein ligase